MFRIRFENANKTPCYVQVDPWAGLYQLYKGEAIEIEASSTVECPSIEFDECGETKILTLPDCEEYFVVQDGKRLHWTEFATNLPAHSD